MKIKLSVMRAGGKQSGLKKNEKKNERQNIQEAICLAGWFATANEIYDLKKFSFFFFQKSIKAGVLGCLSGWRATISTKFYWDTQRKEGLMVLAFCVGILFALYY